MENKLLESNLEILKKFNLDVYNYVTENMDELESAKVYNIEPALAEEGSSFELNVKDKKIQLDSRYMPQGIANVWAEAQGELNQEYIFILYGLGSGKYLSALKNNIRGTVFFLVYEPNKELFLNSLKVVDYREFPEFFHIIIEGINESMFSQYLMHYVKIHNRDVVKWAIHPNYAAIYEESVNKCKAQLQSRMLDLISEANMARDYAELMTENAINAMKYYKDCSIIDQIADVSGKDFSSDIPAIVVSPGPSLKKNIEVLKKAKNRAFIIATDTALNLLLNEGIIPDAFVIVDCHKSLRKFTNEETQHIPMFTTETAKGQVLDMLCNKKIFMNNSLGYANVLFNELGKDYAVNGSGGSVATVCYMVAKRMGFKKIILVGQDLAYTGNSRYANPNLKVSGLDIDNENDKDMFLEVEDINGNPVKTSYDFKMYLDWFVNTVAYDKGTITVWDATEGGAKIEGTIIDTLENVLNNECREEFDFENYIKSIPEAFSEEEKELIKQVLLTFPDRISAIKEKAREGTLLYKEMVEMVDNNSIDGAKLQQISDKVSEIVMLFEESAEYQLISNLCMHIENEIISGMLQDNGDNENELKVLANKGVALMEATEMGVGQVLEMYNENVLSKL